MKLFSSRREAEVREKERLAKEKMERERTERERREREERERERREKERREQEEKERQQYQVDQHFNKTFRLAQHKVILRHRVSSVYFKAVLICGYWQMVGRSLKVKRKWLKGRVMMRRRDWVCDAAIDGISCKGRLVN